MLLMQALSKPEHHERILELMKKLLSVDPLRHGYYRDLSALPCHSCMQKPLFFGNTCIPQNFGVITSRGRSPE